MGTRAKASFMLAPLAVFLARAATARVKFRRVVAFLEDRQGFPMEVRRGAL